MEETKVKCLNCKALILLATANRNTGLCAPCEKVLSVKKTINKESSTWVLAGNIVTLHPRKKDEKYLGTQLFRANAKVYLASLQHHWAVLEPEKLESLKILAQHKDSGSWIVSYIDSTLIKNWRCQICYKPAVIKRLKQEQWPGFSNQFSWDDDRTDKNAIKALLESLVESEYS